MSPSRYSRLEKPFSRAVEVPNSTIFSELSIAMTRSARWASNCEKVPSPAPRSAITMGGINFSKVSPRAFQDRPGQ